MSMTIRAVYAGGVLHPSVPLGIAEGATVEITIAPAAAVSPADEGLIQRIQACKSYDEWLEVTKSLPPDDGGYDIAKALDENRRWSGERPLLAEEGQQP
jgi:predicted DNA-binding antitoxin AbrB/MazE fold protein